MSAESTEMLAILESNHAKPTRVCGMGVVSVSVSMKRKREES